MKVAFVGAQCSGKTTTFWDVCAYFKKQQVDDFCAIQEVARDCPYAINSMGSFQTNVWCVTEQIRREMAAHVKWNHILSDRSVYDELPYYRALMSPYYVEKECARYHLLYDIIHGWVKLAPYDALFWFRPLPMRADPDRSPNLKYQQRIDELFADTLQNVANVHEVAPMPHEKRAKLIIERIGLMQAK